jgi:selenium metabolism protein YedF
MKEIDVRGLACPAPVLHTKATLEEEKPEAIRVVVDNAASQQNVERFLKSQGFAVAAAREGENFVVVGRCDSTAAAGKPAEAPQPGALPESASKKIVVMCATDRIGFGDEELGLKLMVNFVRTLKEMGPDLWRLILVNNGVRLAVQDSVVLDDLQQLEREGVKILVCGTCLDHFQLLERKRVGETTNMLDVVTALQLAGKVINM